MSENKNSDRDKNSVKKEIQTKYDRFARWYDLAEGIPELLGLRKLRSNLLNRTSGRILEIAVGTGKNLKYYPKNSQVTAVDLSPKMLEIARKRASRLGINVSFMVIDAENLEFPDMSFDTVVDSLSLCTFPDPIAALREMSRVCRREGRILLLEHGRSDREWVGRFQDRRADAHAKQLCCQWNRQPLDLVRQAGLKPISASRKFLGIFHIIEAMP
ncbi:MAG: class I SAM-dependent methyltransferase [Thermodesulfobacteriota bacterium]